MHFDPNAADYFYVCYVKAKGENKHEKILLLITCLLLVIFSGSCGNATQDTSLLAPEGSQVAAEPDNSDRV